MGKEHKLGGSKAQGFAADPSNINKAGRPKDPAVQKFRDAIDGVITADEWAQHLVNILNDPDIETDKKLPALKTLAELRAPGLKIPPELNLEDADINIIIKGWAGDD